LCKAQGSPNIFDMSMPKSPSILAGVQIKLMNYPGKVFAMAMALYDSHFAAKGKACFFQGAYLPE
jgi:hypothetical protein